MSAREGPPCPFCAAERVRRIGSLPVVRLFAGVEVEAPPPAASLYFCPECALKFRYPRLPPARYATLYDNDCSDVWQDALPDRPDWQLVVNYLARHLPSAATVLDFGCYTGGLLGSLDPDIVKFGVEVNAKAREVAARRTGARVVPSLRDLPPGQQFDVVTAVDVVEHFPNPGPILESLLAVTRPGGVVLVTTGDADAPLWRVAGARWWYCFFPEHVAFISERWVRDWLARSPISASLADLQRFAYARLSFVRSARQACLTMLYTVAPSSYLAIVGAVRRRLGRRSITQAPGIGLTRDHIFLVIRKAGAPA